MTFSAWMWWHLLLGSGGTYYLEVAVIVIPSLIVCSHVVNSW